MENPTPPAPYTAEEIAAKFTQLSATAVFDEKLQVTVYDGDLYEALFERGRFERRDIPFKKPFAMQYSPSVSSSEPK